VCDIKVKEPQFPFFVAYFLAFIYAKNKRGSNDA
jgi:hypothetical protein